ncbi:MAG TPA: hypothetical protein VL500_07555 [Candidatus Eisenbacteria bacterium]|nr:hypothetical protein [Candidatus Eisenbacteria bacterium]
MHEFLQFLPVLAFVMLIAAAGLLAVAWERKQARTWTVVAEGAYAGFEHRKYRYSTRSGAMVHTTTYHVGILTIVRLDDGRSFSINGRHEPDIAPGTAVRIHRNGLGAHRLERLA